MEAVLFKFYALRVRRQLRGSGAQFAAVNRHYLRVARMYGFRLGA